MSRGRHAKPSSLPSASTTLAAAAPAVLMVAAAAPAAGHQAAPAASAPGAAAPVASAGLSPSGTAHGLRIMATGHVRSGDSLSTLARRYYHHAGWWPRIWWANRHQVANPNEIRAGEAFIIPVPRAPRPSTVVGALHAIPKPPPPPP